MGVQGNIKQLHFTAGNGNPPTPNNNNNNKMTHGAQIMHPQFGALVTVPLVNGTDILWRVFPNKCFIPQETVLLAAGISSSCNAMSAVPYSHLGSLETAQWDVPTLISSLESEKPCSIQSCIPWECHARSANFWMAANTRTLLLAPFDKFLVP